MTRALFVSDIHISSAQDVKLKKFLSLLDYCLTTQVTDLFLVGDIFDLWIADRKRFVTEYHAVIEKIRQLCEAGIRVRYFEGNHDLDLRPLWERRVGVEVFSEGEFFLLDGLRVRVEHGDQMDPDDRGYLFLRWLLRTPLLVLLGRCLPDFAVDWIGQRASSKSREYTTHVKSATDEAVREKMKTHALNVYKQKPYDIFISGHVHVPADIPLDGIRCLNMGTWLKEPMAVLLEDGRVNLMKLGQLTGSLS